MVRGRTILLILALAAPSLARAADPIMTFSESTAMLAKICGAEITANCRGVNPTPAGSRNACPATRM